MQKMRDSLLLPALLASSFIMSMENQAQLTGSDSSFKSFEDITATSRDIQTLFTPHAEGNASGSGSDDDTQSKPQYPAPLKPWHWTNADVFIMPDSPKTKKSNKPKEEQREKIRENFGKKFEQESKKEKGIDVAIDSLKELNLDSTRPRKSSSPSTLTPPVTRQIRVLSHETPLPRSSSNPFNTASKTSQATLSLPSSTPTPPNSPLQSSTEIAPETPRAVQTPPQTPRGVKNEIPQIPVTPPVTPSPNPTPPASPRSSSTETPTDPSKTSAQETGISEKKEDATISKTPQKINPSSMHPLTWKDRRIALLTITGVTLGGLLILLYYYRDQLPGSVSTKMDNLLATFRMNR